MVTVPKKKKNNQQDVTDVRNVIEDQQVQIGQHDIVQFEEDGDNVVMDIDDGGQAAHEFQSDNEATDVETEPDDSDKSEGEYTDPDTSLAQESMESEDSDREGLQTPSKRHSSSVSHQNRDRRQSVEDKLDTLTDTLKVMQNMMIKKGFFDEDKPKAKKKGKTTRKSRGKNIELNECNKSDSRTTIYQNILQKKGNDGEPVFFSDPEDPEVQFKQNQVRESTSSEDRDQADTSDELMDMEMSNRFIADCAAEAERRRSGQAGSPPICDERTVDRGADMVREAEASKKQMLVPKGKFCETGEVLLASVNFDEKYQIVGGNIDPGIRSKIISHEYVDFAKLLPHDRVSSEEDHRMELISKGGHTYFVPIADREVSGIHTLSRWEQAFRVFSNVYTQEYPHRAPELIQYNQVICTAAQSFLWENVYHYDKEFRLHLANFPKRSWAIILQQAWTMCLKDRLRTEYVGRHGQKGGKKEACKQFNRGECTAGLSCKYDHRCMVLERGKFGHGAHICHKQKGAQANQNNASGNANVNAGVNPTK